MPKTDLEKSHSKLSNFKLTLICLLLSLSCGLVIVSIGAFKAFQTYSIIGLIIGCILGVFSYFLLSKFTR